MRFAICNETYPNWPFEKVCEDAAACGYDAIELAPFTLKEDPRELTEADALRLSQIASSFGLEILGLHWLLTKPAWFHITTPDSLQRKETAKFGQHLARICAMTASRPASRFSFSSRPSPHCWPTATWRSPTSRPTSSRTRWRRRSRPARSAASARRARTAASWKAP